MARRLPWSPRIPRAPSRVRPAAPARLALPLALALSGCAAGQAVPVPAVTAPEPAPPDAPPIALRIVLRGVNFGFDDAEVDPASAVILDVAAEEIRERPRIQVAIVGHTDSVGAEAYNQALSQRRAEAVRRYLERKGVPAEALTARGLGESEPVASNETDDGRARNRRVELEVAQ
jgi:OOP family OmpA-OmpF porin